MSEIWCDNNPSATPESILHHWLNGVFIPDRSDEQRYFASVGKTDGFTQPETMLWISAIWQAIMDIENPIGKDADMIRFDALSWVMNESEEMGSFKFACNVLGLDPWQASKKIVGNRKIKLPEKINVCPDCGEFIRQNLKRCQPCAEVAHAEQKSMGYEAWYEKANGRKYMRELKRKRRARLTPEQLAESRERLRIYQREYQKKRKNYVREYQRERREIQKNNRVIAGVDVIL